MPEARIDELLEQLCSRDSHEAWSAFLEQYASLILQVIRHFKGDSDDSADCFQFVCERLCEDRFSPAAPVQMAWSGQVFDLAAGSDTQSLPGLAKETIRQETTLSLD